MIVALDPEAHRLAWSARTEQLSHHNASVQAFDAGDGRTRIVWIADLLPDEVAGPIASIIDHAMSIMKTTLEKTAGS